MDSFFFVRKFQVAVGSVTALACRYEFDRSVVPISATFHHCRTRSESAARSTGKLFIRIIYSNASLHYLLFVYVTIAKCEIFRFEGIGTFGRRHGSDIELNRVRVKSNHRVRDHVHHGHRRDARSLRRTSLVKSTEIAAVRSVVSRTKMSGGS